MSPSELSRFWEEPGGHILLSPDLVIQEVGQEYARRTLISPQNVVGKYFFDVFPDNPRWKGATGSINVRASMQAAMQSKIPDKMPVQRYDICNREREWECRWWLITHIPLLDSEGNVSHLVQRIEDVTLSEITSQRIDRQRINNYTLYLLVLISMAIIVWSIGHSNQRIQAFRHTNCLIQQRDLPAGKELDEVMNDIHKVLTFPELPYQKAAARAMPPSLRKHEQGVVRDLNHHLVKFNFLESMQPQTITCP